VHERFPTFVGMTAQGNPSPAGDRIRSQVAPCPESLGMGPGVA